MSKLVSKIPIWVIAFIPICSLVALGILVEWQRHQEGERLVNPQRKNLPDKVWVNPARRSIKYAEVPFSTVELWNDSGMVKRTIRIRYPFYRFVDQTRDATLEESEDFFAAFQAPAVR